MFWTKSDFHFYSFIQQTVFCLESRNIFNPADNFGTVVGESPDRLLLSGTVVGENPDHVCWEDFMYAAKAAKCAILRLYRQNMAYWICMHF